MQILSITVENGDKVRCKYLRSSSYSPLVLFLVHRVNDSVQNSIVNTLRGLHFNVLVMEARSTNRDLMNAVFCWSRLRSLNPYASKCFVIGVNDGAWVGMQLLMRRPEFDRFIAINPPIKTSDFSFLAPCPCSGIIIDAPVSEGESLQCTSEVSKFVQKTSINSPIKLEHCKLSGGFSSDTPDVIAGVIRDYIVSSFNAIAS
ncbi:hypothetical protein [Candidatus Gromoviella agglomerans]|uniref:hypothetical protein n=1 Tax=Candidatus Gromoviella agglomerans TaxID=2806609 RepID=UPI001E4D1A93|nr:hypothetical protein [Candidatus Gromoviella agglomerans]UFX98540.1 Alpha/beta superfamily hydrolase domain-containing protein [Candidatus Gromoviella agglomerans]